MLTEVIVVRMGLFYTFCDLNVCVEGVFVICKIH